MILDVGMVVSVVNKVALKMTLSALYKTLSDVHVTCSRCISDRFLFLLDNGASRTSHLFNSSSKS